MGTPTQLQPFKLERFFAKHEFTAPFLACCSDCEPLHLAELLALADEDAKARWENLRLSYTETQGLPELRREVAAKYFTAVQPEDLVVMAPQEGVYLTMRALIEPGDHVVVTYPGYQSLYEVGGSIGASISRWEPRVDPSTASCTFNVDDAIALIQPATKMVVINFPHNPTGALISRADLDKLVAACRQQGCWLFSDEMYRLLERDPSDRLPSVADLYERGISLGGCSKALALPGLRLGWIAARDRSLVSRLLELKDYTTICAAGPSEVLALVAVRASDKIASANLELIEANIRLFQTLVDEFPEALAWTPPPASSVAFPRIKCLSPGQDIEAWSDGLIAAKGLALLPASVYDHAPTALAGHFRLGLGRKNFSQCMALLREYLLELRQAKAGN